MPPIPFDNLIIGRTYFLRDTHNFVPPFGQGPVGSAAFQLLRIDPVGTRVFIFTDLYGNPHEFEVPPGASERWNYYPSEEGLPVRGPVAVPVAVPAPLPYAGPIYVPEGTESVLMSNIQNDTELVNWGESAYGHYYTAANYAGLPNPKLSPMTRVRIVNPKRYTVSRKPVNNAFPAGSASANLFGGRRARKSRRRRGTKSRKSRRS